MASPAPSSAPGAKGHVLNWAGRYDLLVWLLTLGRERRFREKLLAPVRLGPGESVLDVGCGTGSLAIAAKRQVGETGAVQGIDASPQMIVRARHKARKAGLQLDFADGIAESLPFPDGQFDVVLSTVMLHHLGETARPVAVAEMKRVLKPGGRLLVVDFAGVRNGKGPLMHFHRHGHVDPKALVDLVSSAGFGVVESGPLGTWSLSYVLGATKTIHDP